MRKKLIILSALLQLIISVVIAQPRFPEPEFETEHTPPPTQVIQPRSIWFEYTDVVVLLGLMSLATWLILKKRSRNGIILTGILSILYFGFWRKGCVCSIGSIQNIALGITNIDYVLPISVILFFAIPLIFAIFFGRIFCSSVCIFGAVQDLVNLKPVKIPNTVQKSLSILPYLYLGFAILFAATNSDFIICRYDPFIAFFRLDGKFYMIISGIILLIISIFIARPYCRFLCPYGVILGWLSKISYKHLKITPAECINCSLCKNSCQVEAINNPTQNIKNENNKSSIKRLVSFIILLPFFVFLFGFLMSLFYKPLSYTNFKVKLANEITTELNTGKKSNSPEAIAFNSSGIPVNQLIAEAIEIQNDFRKGTWWLGGFFGFVIGLTLIRTSIIRKRKYFEPDKVNCINCGRCFDYCPVKPT